MKFLFWIFNRKRKQKPVSVLDEIVNDTDWYKPKKHRHGHKNHKQQTKTNQE